jgi:hypothetical protein
MKVLQKNCGTIAECKLLLTQPSSKESYPLITKWFQEIWKSALSITDINEAKKGLSYIFQILTLIGKPQLTDEVLLSIRNYQQPLSLPYIYASAVLDAIESCKKEAHHLNILKKIAEDFLKHAQASYAFPPKPPETWARSGQLKCTCSFCDEVNGFLPDHHRSSVSFEKTLQRNLIHIKTKIAEHSLDLDVSIDRQPPKFKGTVTKNQNSYEQALKRFTIVDQTKKRVELWMKSCFSQ